jgi:hypothetical protein
MKTITGKSMRDELLTMARGLAYKHFRRLHPRASEASAWRYAAEHVEEFRGQAATTLALIYARREAEQQARDRIN